MALRNSEHWFLPYFSHPETFKQVILQVTQISFYILPWIFCSVIISLLGFTSISYVRMLFQRRTLPPGPFPFPIVGNCLQLSRSKPWLQFKEWSRTYNSGLITIWIGRTPTVICNDAWCASDLLDKRSNTYSSRPRYVVFGEVTGQSKTNQVLLPYNDHWRLQRKVMVSTAGRRTIPLLQLTNCFSTQLLALKHCNPTKHSKQMRDEFLCGIC